MTVRAICVFGVNGVGKTTLLEKVKLLHPRHATVTRGSEILMSALGVTSYESLERLSPPQKKRALIDGIIARVTQIRDSVLIVDTHLVVPIRTEPHTVTVEDMWDERLMSAFDGFAYITAEPSTIARRRRETAGERVHRARSATPEICEEDLQINRTRWDELSPRMRRKHIVVNDRTIQDGALAISEFIQTLGS